MFIEFIDQLRCTRSHEDSWLVASFAEQENRFILRGKLGCPICFAEYPIVRGTVYFGATPPERDEAIGHVANEEMAMRIAAYLNLVTEGAAIALVGSWASHAPAVSAMVSSKIFAINAEPAIDESSTIALIRSSEGIPLTPGSVHGVAIDAENAGDVMMESALRVLKPGGRLVAPAFVTVPDGVKELARDDVFWIGETTPKLVPLRRA